MAGNILFICGSLNQTSALHKIAQHFADHNCFFTPFYADGAENFAAQMGWLPFSVLGGRHVKDTTRYIGTHALQVDPRGQQHDYDLIVTCSDLIVQKNIRGKRILLIQDGITEPETWLYQGVKKFGFPRYLANTAALGLSDAYHIFCVASPGYRDLFISKGARAEKLSVTGMPNFDDLASYARNDFPYHDYVLVATSPLRESFRFDDRIGFITRCIQIANGRPLIFKLHPSEDVGRARREIRQLAPKATIYMSGNINPMIANASVVITQQSSCTYVALALGKELYTNLDVGELKRLMPIQNGGGSAQRIAEVARQLLETPLSKLESAPSGLRPSFKWRLTNLPGG